MKVIIIGAGHNGLVSAICLARQGLDVTVLEEKETIGGATKTETPFIKVPGLRHSTASYLLGLMPPELIHNLGLQIELLKRDPHYFLPTVEDKYLLFGTNKSAMSAMREQFLQFFSEADWKANERLSDEISKIRNDLAPSWLKEPLSLEETVDRYIRPELKNSFIDLVSEPIENYLLKLGFKSELLIAMYAVTDGFSGLSSGFNTPKTGMNFLVHNMCRLPDSDGTFMMVRGGMGAIPDELARIAVNRGAKIHTSCRVDKILVSNNKTEGILLNNGETLYAPIVVCNSDPFRIQKMVGQNNFPASFNAKLNKLKRYGTTMKVNMALKKLPVFKCLPENRGQHNATIHILPPEKNIIQTLQLGYEAVQKGRLAEFPAIEWYIATQLDPSLQDPAKHHGSAFFIQWVPYELSESSWEKEEDHYVQHLFSLVEQFAPGFTDSVVEYSALTPKKIEEQFGISYGHIHHIDNTFGFDQRIPYSLPIEGLYACGAGCHPAGSVIGAAGYNSAQKILKDLK